MLDTDILQLKRLQPIRANLFLEQKRKAVSLRCKAKMFVSEHYCDDCMVAESNRAKHTLSNSEAEQMTMFTLVMRKCVLS